MAEAVVIGSGPNGLAAAITLARAGVEVEVYEEADTVGGGVRSAALTLPGFVHDVCSSIYPLAVRSPFFRELDLELEWVQPDAALAHPFEDGRAVTLERSVDATAAQLGADGAAYRRLIAPLVASWDAIEPTLLAPVVPPSPRGTARLLRALGPRGAATAVRAALGDARRLAERTFTGEPARGFFAGNAAHSMLPLERRPTAAFGLALVVPGHVAGWPVVRGGSQALADALAARLRALGGTMHLSMRVDELPAAPVVMADVSPRELLRIASGTLPARYARELGRFRFGPGAFKLDWALDRPIPWRAPECRRAATVHVGGTLDEIAASERRPWSGRPPERPFVLLAQPSLFDDSRAPAGKHTAWAYCHVPNGWAGDATAAVEAQVERFAPGFQDLILARSALGPPALEQHNRNLVGGAIDGGAMTLAQTIFRPTRSLVPYRTGRPGLYLCSASTPPGGGVHGMCGYQAALRALADLGADVHN
jgi:phytoene dehydrogenase-like protein